MSTIKVNRIENTATTDGGINIDSNGKIGVGTASPTETLTLNTSSGASIGFEHNGTEIATINNNAAALYVHAGSGKLLSLGANGSEAMRIDSSGNVGVGVSSLSSSSRLTLLESAGNGQTLEIKGANTGGVGSQPGIKFTASTGDNIGGIYGDTNSDSVILQSGGTERMRIDSSGNLTAYSGSTDGNYFVIRGKHSPGNDYNRSEVRFGVETNANGLGFLAFATGNNTASERLRIDSSGRVGIGTTSPSHGLLTLSQSASSAFNALVIQQGNTGSAATDGLHIGIDSAVDAYIMHKESRALAFGTANTERVRISDSGSVNIGTTSGATNADITLRATAPQLSLYATPGNISRVTLGDTDDWNIGQLGYDNNGNYMFFTTNNVEALRIDSSGNLLIGTTSVGGSGGISLRSNGHFIAPVCYSVGLSASPRDAFIDSNGELGYVPSIRKAKTNIQVQSNVDWLYQLEPVTFNYKTKDRETGNYTDKAEAELEYGLIAEDVETACPDLCFYDQTDNGPELRGVSYKKLITPILKALQDAKAEIETLKTKVAALEAG